MNQEVNKTEFSEEQRISALLSSLPRVEAPGDFDFRVRARIAASRPAEKHASWLPASVRYAVPLALVLAIGGYVGFNAIYLTETPMVPVVAETQAESSPISQPETASSAAPAAEKVVAERVETKPTETVEKASVKDADKGIPAVNRKPERPTGGSFDSAVRSPTTIDPAANVGPAEAPAAGIGSLGSVGISTAPANPGSRVVSVAAGSAAQAAGVRVGDIIESYSGRTLRIRRDGVIMRIVLK